MPPLRNLKQNQDLDAVCNIYMVTFGSFISFETIRVMRGKREDKGSEGEKRSDTESDQTWLPSSPETHSIKKRIRGNFIYFYNMKSGKTGNIGNKLSYLIVKEGDCWCKSSLTLAVLMSLILWLLPPEFVWSQDLGRAAAVKQVKYLNCPHPPSAHAVSC